MDQEWFYTIIDNYLEPLDALSLRTTSQCSLAVDIEKHKRYYFAARLISKTVLRWHANYIIMVAFIERCTNDKMYRMRHFNIHNNPRPHICLFSRYTFLKTNIFKLQWPILWGKMYPQLLCAVSAAQHSPEILRAILHQWPDI